MIGMILHDFNIDFNISKNMFCRGFCPSSPSGDQTWQWKIEPKWKQTQLRNHQCRIVKQTMFDYSQPLELGEWIPSSSMMFPWKNTMYFLWLKQSCTILKISINVYKASKLGWFIQFIPHFPYFWANYNNSLTWILRPWMGMISLTMISRVRS